jgi:hypothetical protein
MTCTYKNANAPASWRRAALTGGPSAQVLNGLAEPLEMPGRAGLKVERKVRTYPLLDDGRSGLVLERRRLPA